MEAIGLSEEKVKLLVEVERLKGELVEVTYLFTLMLVHLSLKDNKIKTSIKHEKSQCFGNLTSR